jgi:hypothetical protein
MRNVGSIGCGHGIGEYEAEWKRKLSNGYVKIMAFIVKEKRFDES